MHQLHHHLRNGDALSDDQDPIDLSPSSLLHSPSNSNKLKNILRSRLLDKLQLKHHDSGMSGIPGAIFKDDAVVAPLNLSGR